MKKVVSGSSEGMIGRVLPFFLDNTNLSNSYYLYTVFSPGINEEFAPVLSLKKISEKGNIKGCFYSQFPVIDDSSILTTLLKTKKNYRKQSVDYLSQSIQQENCTFTAPKSDLDFPTFNYDGLILKSLIVQLRDSIRWAKYKFSVGNYIDAMISSTEFIVFKIAGNDEEIWLEPEGIYENDDVNLENKKDASSFLNYPKQKFTGKTKVSDLNRAIRQFEWNLCSKY